MKALYVGNVEIWQEQVMRVTLFNRPPIPAVAWLGTVARMLCGCCLSRTRPLFVYRISLFWGITMKHLVPSAMVYLVVQGELLVFSLSSREGYDMCSGEAVWIRSLVRHTWLIPLYRASACVLIRSIDGSGVQDMLKSTVDAMYIYIYIHTCV